MPAKVQLGEVVNALRRKPFRTKMEVFGKETPCTASWELDVVEAEYILVAALE
jgi:hypothetical protein